MQTNLNFTVVKGVLEMHLTNLCRSMLKSQQSIVNIIVTQSL